MAALASPPFSARRLLVLTGIALILAGMVFGDVFAVFVLHQNASRVGASLAASAHAALAANAAGALEDFRDVGSFLENRGTKVDTHVHMIAFGYLALLLAVVQPWIGLQEKTKKRIAWLFVFGALLLPVCVFLIHYVGLAYSPLSTIGWASIFADLGGLLVILASVAFLWGLCRRFFSSAPGGEAFRDSLAAVPSTPARWLFSGGVALILLGFLHGAWYASSDLYAQEAADYSLLSRMTSAAAAGDRASVDRALADYGQLQGDKAVKIAAHAHVIEFGILAVLLAFFQPYVQLAEAWRRRWAVVLLLGSLMLPIFVLLELQWGLVAGGLADFGGLLVIVALLAMWTGIVRYRDDESLDGRATS